MMEAELNEQFWYKLNRPDPDRNVHDVSNGSEEIRTLKRLKNYREVVANSKIGEIC
jgi:hypothetical protein